MHPLEKWKNVLSRSYDISSHYAETGCESRDLGYNDSLVFKLLCS